MIDFQRIFHTGLVVPDLEAAMRDLGAALGLDWATPWEYKPIEYWTPEGKVASPLLRVTYSKRGPQHLELIQGNPGDFWGCTSQAGIHHAGAWSDDLGADVAALVKRGWTPEAAAVSPAEGWGRFCYLRAPSGGMLLELLSTQYRPLMESRWV